MRVKSCEASDGRNRPIYLSDENGCVLRPKMISKFTKLQNNDGRATVITYAHFHAFKFPDAMAVHLRCKVEICRFGCPDHCQRPVAGYPVDDFGSHAAGSQNQYNYELPSPQYLRGTTKNNTNIIPGQSDPRNKASADEIPVVVPHSDAAENYIRTNTATGETIELPQKEDFPWGPRSLKRKREVVIENEFGDRKIRRRREIVLERNVRETDIGVTTDIQVISEADLEFALPKDEGVTVFKGQREDILYGICLPAPGFSALFVLLAMCTVISVLVAGFMCHHRQIQKDTVESPATPHCRPISMVHFLRSQLSAVH